MKRDRAQSGCDWSQHTIKQTNNSAVDTCYDDDDDVAHASPFKWDYHTSGTIHTCTESLHTGNDAGLVDL
jgi:wobble nucleotide-excising tRNase